VAKNIKTFTRLYDKNSYMIAPRRFLPSIASLRALEALDRLGSASAVADELALTQSAVSRQLQALERQMGADLILREKKRLSLTPAAQNYAAEIRQALTQIAQASLRLQVSPVGGTLNLAILPTFGMRWLMPRLPDFAGRHPDVTINMATQLVPFNFATRNFDAAIHYGQADWPGTERLLLKSEHVRAVCAPGLLAAKTVNKASDVLNLPLLHIQTRPKAWQDWLEHHAVQISDALPGTMYDQFSTITQAALHGLGVALLPDYLVEQDLAAGRLVPAFGPAVEAQGAYYLVWPREKSRDPSLRLFCDWLADQAQPEDTLPR
jgi:DNA-binding transcriptional LysR family regulator